MYFIGFGWVGDTFAFVARFQGGARRGKKESEKRRKKTDDDTHVR